MKIVKYTSFALLFGFGGYFVYQLIVKKRRGRFAKLFPVSLSSSSLPSSSSQGSPHSQDSEPPSSPLDSSSSSLTNQQESSAHDADVSDSNNQSTTLEETQSSSQSSEIEKPEDDQMNHKDVSSALLGENQSNEKPKDEDTIFNRTEESECSLNSPATTNCSTEVVYPATPCSSPMDNSELDSSDLANESVERYLSQRSFSMTSQSSIIGESTVAKLEQLLHQVGHLKESFGELNVDIATVRKSDPKFFTITGDNLSLGYEVNGESGLANGKEECSQTPSLEWDSNGINLLSDLETTNNSSMIKEEDEPSSLLINLNSTERSGIFSPISSNSTNSSLTVSDNNLSLFSSPSSTISISQDQSNIFNISKEESFTTSSMQISVNDIKNSSLFNDSKLNSAIITNDLLDKSNK